MPTVLLLVLRHLVGLMPALCAVLGWGVLTVSVRWLAGRRMPGTLLLCARAAVSLILSSALVYLLQPVAGSVLMAVLFLGSAAIGGPITMRLARDFVHLPAQLFQRRGVRKVFSQVAWVWGTSRLVDAGMSLGFLRWGIDAGLLSRGFCSGALTVLTILTCALWGARRLRRLPGITLRLHASTT